MTRIPSHRGPGTMLAINIVRGTLVLPVGVTRYVNRSNATSSLEVAPRAIVRLQAIDATFEVERTLLAGALVRNRLQ